MNRRELLTTTAATFTASSMAGCTSTQNYGTYTCETKSVSQTSELPAPIYGPEDAPNRVAVFEDFSCPHCRTFHLNVLPELKERATNDSAPRFNIEHYDSPIPVSKWSRRVANAARYIQDKTTDDNYFTFSQAAFEAQSQYSWDVLGEIVTDNNMLDSPCGMFNAVTGKKYEQVITADRQLAFEALGFTSTPSVVVNNTPIEDISLDTIMTVLENK